MPLVSFAAEAGTGTASDPASVFAWFPAGPPVGVPSSVAETGEDVSALSECGNGDDGDRARIINDPRDQYQCRCIIEEHENGGSSWEIYYIQSDLGESTTVDDAGDKDGGVGVRGGS